MLTRTTRTMAAVLVITFSAVCLTVKTSQAANDCILKPNAAPPQGTHWYYRVDRATQRKCWYLGAEGTRVQPRVIQAAAKTQKPKPASKPIPETTAQAPATAVIAESAEQNADTARDDTTATLSTRWSGFSRSAASFEPAPSSMSSSYTREPATTRPDDDMPLVWPILTPAELAQAERSSQSSIPFWQLAAAFVAVLALAALIGHALFRLTATRKSARPAPGQRRVAPQSRATVVARLAGAQARKAPETEASVQRLLQELRRREAHQQQDFRPTPQGALA